MRGKSPSEFDHVLTCYATPPLASATAAGANRHLMSISQYVRGAILEKLAADGIELREVQRGTA